MKALRFYAPQDVRLEDEARRLENAAALRELATGIATAIEGEEDALLPRLAAYGLPVDSARLEYYRLLDELF